MNNDKRRRAVKTLRVEDQPFMKALDEASQHLEPKGVYDLTVIHDDWCDLRNDEGLCNCEPNLIIVQLERGVSRDN